MHRRAFRVLLLVMILPGLPGAACRRADHRDRGAGPLRRVRLTCRGSAHVTFFDRDEPDWRVVTQGQGRFRWVSPGNQAISPERAGQEGPACGVMVQDARSWAWEVVGADAAQPLKDHARNFCLRSLRKPATSRWEVTNQGPRLIVECPAAGEVKVVVHGPDGAVLADRVMHVLPVGGTFRFPGDTNIMLRGRTDAAGAFHLRWFEGILQLQVLVPEVGFGATGSFEILAGRTARPDLPPLARFAKVEGTLDAKLIQPGIVVNRPPDPGNACVWARGQSALDGQGRFVLRNVVPGSFQLAVGRPGPIVFLPVTGVRVRAEPGQSIQGLVIRPPPPPEGPPASIPPEFREAFGGDGDQAENVIWVEGTVRDASGHGVAGADVVVRSSYHGGIRMYERFREGITDPQGRYRIMGPRAPFMSSLIVVVRAKGRPPAVAYAEAPHADKSERGPLDVTLAGPGAGGSVRVRVLKDGKPMPGAEVALNSEGVIALSMWAAPSKPTPVWTEIQEHFEPRATTGADGVARFANVFPGIYDVVAAERPPWAAEVSIRRLNPDREYALAKGLGVAAGEEVETTIALHPLALEVPMQVLRPDGAPVANQGASICFGLGGTNTCSSLDLDGRGIGARAFESPGLWSVNVRFRDSALRSFPIDEEPYYQAEALLPVSPASKMPDPVRLKGVRRDRGSLRVELRDVEGRPSHGAVMFVTVFGLSRGVDRAASTDARGLARFADLTHGEYRVHGSIDGLAPPFLPEPGPGPMPGEAALRDQLAFEDVEVPIKAGVEHHVVLQPKKVGYVRGTLRPPAGRSVADYLIWPEHDAR